MSTASPGIGVFVPDAAHRLVLFHDGERDAEPAQLHDGRDPGRSRADDQHVQPVGRRRTPGAPGKASARPEIAFLGHRRPVFGGDLLAERLAQQADQAVVRGRSGRFGASGEHGAQDVERRREDLLPDFFRQPGGVVVVERDRPGGTEPAFQPAVVSGELRQNQLQGRQVGGPDRGSQFAVGRGAGSGLLVHQSLSVRRRGAGGCVSCRHGVPPRPSTRSGCGAAGSCRSRFSGVRRRNRPNAAACTRRSAPGRPGRCPRC